MQINKNGTKKINNIFAFVTGEIFIEHYNIFAPNAVTKFQDLFSSTASPSRYQTDKSENIQPQEKLSLITDRRTIWSNANAMKI